MGYASQQFKKDSVNRQWKINPVWRGIGCFLLILIPIMAWMAAALYLQSNDQLPLAEQINKPITMRFTRIAEIDRVISNFNQYTINHKIVVGQIILTVIFIVIGYGLLAFMYAVLYRIAGPPRYGPFDVPPDVMRR